MDKEKFLSLPIQERVKYVNNMLHEYSLSEIAEKLGISSSTFSKIMREGDYLYHQGEKTFFPFVRSETDRKSGVGLQKSNIEIMDFVKEHIVILKQIVDEYSETKQLILDERIYGSKANYVNKNMRMNKDIYDEFVKFCKRDFPGLTIQHLCSQALIEFIAKYEKSR